MVQTVFNSIQPPSGSGKTMSQQEQWVRNLADAQQAAMPLAANATIVISNLYGQTLKTLPLNEYGTTTLHTATLANGIYYCRLLQNGNTTAIQKLVILH